MKWKWISRIASLPVVATYLILAAVHEGSEGFWSVAIFMIFPLALIWLDRWVGGYTGSVRGVPMSSPTPGCLVAAAGWLFLIGIPLMIWMLTK